MKMIGVGQLWVVRVAPAFSIQMQTKHQIGMQFDVHQRSPTSNFAVAIKQNFALPANGLLFGWIVCIKRILARARHAVFDQNFPCELPKVIGAFCRSRFFGIPDERNFRAAFTQSPGQQSRHVQSQIAFLNWLAGPNLKPALFHLCPFPAQVAGIERDLQTRKRFLRSRWQQ